MSARGEIARRRRRALRLRFAFDEARSRPAQQAAHNRWALACAHVARLTVEPAGLVEETCRRFVPGWEWFGETVEEAIAFWARHTGEPNTTGTRAYEAGFGRVWDEGLRDWREDWRSAARLGRRLWGVS